MSIVVESSFPAVPQTRRLYTYDELVAEMPETNQPYELVQRSQHGGTAASRLLAGFEISVGYLFRGTTD